MAKGPHQVSRRVALSLIGGIVLALVPRGAKSEVRAILESPNSAASENILTALRKRFPDMHASPFGSLPLPRPAVTYLAIGPSALRAALAGQIAEPLLALFSSRQSFDSALKDASKYPAMRISGIYAEASPAAQFELIAAIYQRRVTVGVMLTDVTAAMQPRLEIEASKAGLHLITHRLEPGGNVVRELGALSTAAVVLALPDTTIISTDTIRGILESTYRRGQAIIGFTPAMVNAGTLASAYSTVDDVLDQLPQLLSEFEAGRTPAPRYPAYWRVAVNESVARSLNLVLPEAARQLARRKPAS